MPLTLVRLQKQSFLCYNALRRILLLVLLVCFGAYGSIASSKCGMMLVRQAQILDKAHRLLKDWTLVNTTTTIVHPNQSSIEIPQNVALSTASFGHFSTLAVADLHAGVSTSTLAHLWWQFPQCGRLKCNVDSSFPGQLNRTCISMC